MTIAKRVSAGLAAAMWIGCGGASSGGTGTTTPATGATTSASSSEASGNPLPDATRAVSTPHAMSAAADRALVVLVCPAECEPFAIVDATGAILGEVASHQRAVLDVAPGAVAFYALADRAEDRIAGTVAAGGVYYAAISTHGASARFVTLTAQAADGRWDHVSEYLADTSEHEIDPARRPSLDERIVTPQLRTRIADLDTRAGEMDPTHRGERTIRPEDGTAIPPPAH